MNSNDNIHEKTTIIHIGVLSFQSFNHNLIKINSRPGNMTSSAKEMLLIKPRHCGWPSRMRCSIISFPQMSAGCSQAAGKQSHKDHFPGWQACCDMSHAFCLVPGIWGCLPKVAVNTSHNSSFHKVLYFRKKWVSITYRRHVTSIPIVTWKSSLYCLTRNYLRALRTVCHRRHADNSFGVATNTVKIHTCVDSPSFIFCRQKVDYWSTSKC